MALNEVYELSLDTRMRGQLCSNVFYYRELATAATGLPNQAQALASAFLLQAIPNIRDIMAVDVDFVALRARSLWDDNVSHEILLTGTGALNGQGGTIDVLPTFNALSFKLSNNNAAVRAGFKRFVGLIEDWQTDGVIIFTTIAAAAIAAMENMMENRLNDTLTGLIQWFEPVVVRRVRSGTPGNYTYRLPRNAAETIVGVITQASADILVSSQTSRKVGQGS
jgi:hypothetical protein